MGVGHVVLCDADLVAQGVAHLLHAREGAVVEVAGVAVGARAAALKGHVVVLSAAHRDEVEELCGVALELAQLLIVLVKEGLKALRVERERGVEVVVDAFGEQVADAGLVAAVDALVVGRLVLFLDEEVRADDDDEREHHHDELKRLAPADEEHADEAAGGEGREGGHEPAGDHGEHARDTVHGGLAVPGAVGERRTHGDHEGHVRGRERELQARGRGDERGGEHEVHAGADLVERQLDLARRELLLLEARG